ncbi:hypothetical protein U1Q18_051936 [Sarracenia purpurea var. burkii]
MVTMASSATSSIGVTPLSPDVTTTTVQKKSSENRRAYVMRRQRRPRRWTRGKEGNYTAELCRIVPKYSWDLDALD